MRMAFLASEFEDFLAVLPQEGLDKLSVLTNYVTENIRVYRRMY